MRSYGISASPRPSRGSNFAPRRRIAVAQGAAPAGSALCRAQSQQQRAEPPLAARGVSRDRRASCAARADHRAHRRPGRGRVARAGGGGSARLALGQQLHRPDRIDQPPTIVLVGGGHFTSFLPYPAALTPLQVRFVWHELPCYHCFWLCTQPQAAGASYPCLAAVSLAQVRDAAEELLALRSDKAGTMIELR